VEREERGERGERGGSERSVWGCGMGGMWVGTRVCKGEGGIVRREGEGGERVR